MSTCHSLDRWKLCGLRSQQEHYYVDQETMQYRVQQSNYMIKTVINGYRIGLAIRDTVTSSLMSEQDSCVASKADHTTLIELG